MNIEEIRKKQEELNCIDLRFSEHKRLNVNGNRLTISHTTGWCDEVIVCTDKEAQKLRDILIELYGMPGVCKGCGEYEERIRRKSKNKEENKVWLR